MRILWFTNTPSCYSPEGNAYNGGGWISSAENAMSKMSDVDLAISFFMENQPFKVEGDNVHYYPISIPESQSKLSKIISLFRSDFEEQESNTWSFYLEKFENIINDFKPDIIQVWGSEMQFGLVGKIAKVPVILHIQGILNPYLNAYLPPFVGWSDYKKFGFNIKKYIYRLNEVNSWKRNCFREREILKSIRIIL